VNLATLRKNLEKGNIDLDSKEKETLKLGDFVLVLLNTLHNTQKYYVGQIVLISEEYEIKFLRNKNFKFIWPLVEDRSLVPANQIIKKLNEPTDQKRGLTFDELKHFNLKIE